MDMKLEDIDLTDEDTWADHIPHDQFSFLRAEAPIYRHPGNTIGDRVIEDFWALTRHADVQVVNRDTSTFSSEQRGVMVSEPDEETSAHFRTMLDTDPPAHTRLRRLVNRGFTPRMVTRFEAHYAQLTADLLAKAVAQGTFDFVTDVAAELPLMAIAEILGVPVEDRHKLFEWSNKLVGNSDPEYVGSADDALAAATELYVYFNLLGEERRAEPGDDIISRLITEVDGDALGPHEFETFCLLLTVAGNETTRNATSHGMHALLEHPDQMQLLRDSPELLDPAIEEILRWATPVINFRRTATCATEVGGQAIAEGDALVMYYLSANRDETVFEDPFTFDITRDPNDHIAFGGGGAHHCLGANLARLELQIIFKELLASTRSITQAGDVARLRSNFINGIKHMPVEVELA
ncbi:MAG TPA: cytochrome P450 [Acidimicrobiales bacterium]